MKELRLKRYPKVESWCVDLGRSFRAVQNYELGHCPPPLVLERAAELLKVHPGKFFVEVDK